MSIEIAGGGRVGLQQTESLSSGRLGQRAVAVGNGQGARIASGSGGFLGGVKALAARVLDAVTPSGVRVQSKAARADAALGRAMDRGVQALMSGKDGVKAFANELSALRKGEAALGRAGIDLDATLAQGLRNRFAALSDAQLKSVMSCLHSDALQGLRERLIDGPGAEEQALLDALDASGLAPGVGDDSARLGAVRDLSIFETLALDEALKRTTGRANTGIDTKLEEALAQVGREHEGVKGAVAYVLPTACIAARTAVAELRQIGALPEGATPDETARADEARAFGMVRERLEAMGDETRAVLLRYADSGQLQQLQDGVANLGNKTPLADRAIATEISQRTERLTRTFEAGVARIVDAAPPSPDDASDFVPTLRDTVTTLRDLQQHARVFSLDLTPIDPEIGRLLGALDGVSARGLDLAERSNDEIRDLASSLKRLGVDHLDKPIGEVIAQRNGDARQAYRDRFDEMVAVLGAPSHAGLPAALERLQAAAQHALDVANELGANIEGADKVSPFRSDLLEEAVNAADTEALQGALERMRTPEFASATRLLEDAASHLLGTGDEMATELGRTTFNAMMNLSMFDAAMAEILGNRGAEVPQPSRPSTTPGADAQALLRELSGVEAHGNGFRLVATQRPQPPARDFSLEACGTRLLDAVARVPFEPDAMLETGFTFNQVFAAGQSEQGNIDADNRQGARADLLQRLLADASDAQLSNLRDQIHSPLVQNLIGGVDLVYFGDGSGRPVPEAELNAIAKLGASTESFKILQIVVDRLAETRGLPAAQFPDSAEIRRGDQITSANRQAIDGAIASIRTLDTVRPVAQTAQAVSPGFNAQFGALLLQPTSGSAFAEAVDRDGVSRGVASAFYTDLGRATYTLSDGDQRTPLLARTERMRSEEQIETAKQQAIESLRTFCGGDATHALSLSRYLNQATFAAVEAGLSAEDMVLPTTGEPIFNLVRGETQVAYNLVRQTDTRYQIDFDVSWPLRGIIGENGMTPLHSGSSMLAVGFSMVLDLSDPNAPGLTASAPQYDLRVTPGVTFEVR